MKKDDVDGVDDVVDVIEEEADEEIKALGGVTRYAMISGSMPRFRSNARVWRDFEHRGL